MKDYFLLLFAIVSLILLFIPMFVYQIVNDKFKRRDFAFNLAKNIDYVGGTLFFNSDGHTISALAYKNDVKWAVRAIDWLFRDKNHCHDAWLHEF